MSQNNLLQTYIRNSFHFLSYRQTGKLATIKESEIPTLAQTLQQQNFVVLDSIILVNPPCKINTMLTFRTLMTQVKNQQKNALKGLDLFIIVALNTLSASEINSITKEAAVLFEGYANSIRIVGHELVTFTLPKRADFTRVRVLTTADLEALKNIYLSPSSFGKISCLDAALIWQGDFEPGTFIELLGNSLGAKNAIWFRKVAA